MGSTHRSTMPDLFLASPVRGAASITNFAKTTPTSTQRHILPNNLPAAIKHLNDGELDQLLSAVVAEQERRGTKKETVDQPVRKPQSETVSASLSVGKLNAIRAAFKAGVKPSRIAREFGLSQSDVRKVLAADNAKR
jgi:hypothetical protein